MKNNSIALWVLICSMCITASTVKASVPEITSRTPLIDATGISTETGLTISVTFDQNYKFTGGKRIHVKRYSNDDILSSSGYDIDATFFTNTFTFNLGTPLSYKTKYYIEIEEGAFLSHTDEPFPGTLDKDAWSFTTELDPLDDQVAPALSINYPSNSATDISRRNLNLNFQFDEPVHAVNGKIIEIRRYDDDVAEKTFDTFGNGISDQWNTGQEGDEEFWLSGNTQFYIFMEEGLFEDQWGNPFSGITNKDTWTFTTQPLDLTAPSMTGSIPLDDATDFFMFPSYFIISFDENLYHVPETSGKVKIYKSGESSPLYEIGAYEALYAGNSNMYLYFDEAFEPLTEYYITIDGGTFQDLEGNAFAGFTDDQTVNFTTGSFESELSFISSFTPSRGQTEVSTDLEYVEITAEEELWGGEDGYYYLRKTIDNSIVIEWKTEGDIEFGYDEEREINYARMPIDVTLEEGTSYYVDNKYNAEGGIEPGIIQYSALIGDFDDTYIDVTIPSWETDYWVFTTSLPDTQAPQMTSASPENGASGISVDLGEIHFEFDEPLFKGSSNNFTLTGGEYFKYFDFNNPDHALFDGNSLTLYISEAMPYGTEMNVLLSLGSIRDEQLNEIDELNISFTTESAPDIIGPTFVSLSPSHQASGVELASNFLVEFNENIQAGEGTMMLRDGAQNVVQLFQVSDVVFSGNQLIIDPTADLEPGALYEVVVPVTFVTDLAGNFHLGIGTTDWTFTSVGLPDTQSPQIVSRSIENGSEIHPSNIPLSITFDEPVMKGTGFIQLINADFGNVVLEYSASTDFTTDANTWSFTGTANTSLAGGSYYWVIPSSGITDASGNEFEGFAEDEWYFTTYTTYPRVLSLSPDKGSGEVSVDTQFTLTFSENVRKGTGPIILRTYEGQNNVTSWDVSDTEVAIDGSVVTLTPKISLPYDTRIYVYINVEAFFDLEDNPFVYGSFSEEKYWEFTTEAAEDTQAPQISVTYPSHNALRAPFQSNIEIEFNENIVRTGTNGTIRIYRASDDQLLADRSISQVTIEENKLISAAFSILPRETELYVLMDADLLEDEAGNKFSGIDDTNAWRFTTETVEQAFEVYGGFSPTQAETEVSVDLVAISFEVNEPFTINNIGLNEDFGAIHLYDMSSSSVVKKWSLMGEGVSIDENTITISQLPVLEYGKTYAVIMKGVYTGIIYGSTIYHGALRGEKVRSLIAWNDNFEYWTFTTEAAEDTQAPQIISFSPPNGSVDVSTNTSLIITFDEPIRLAGNGATKQLILWSDGSNVAIPLNDETISIDNAILTIQYDGLERGKTYSITLADEIFEDLSGNWFESGWSAQDIWSFSTEKQDQVITIDPISDKLTTDEPFEVVASTSSLLELFYTVQGPAIINGTTVSLTGESGQVTINVSQPGNSSYHAASAKVSFNASPPSRASQTISFIDIPDGVYGDVVILSASATSSLDVEFELLLGSGTFDGNNLTLSGTGNYTVRAIQTGSDDFNAAPSVEKSFIVAKAPLTVTAESHTIRAGEAIPNLTFTYLGFVLDDDQSVIDVEPTATTEATINSTSGTYDINLSAGEDDTYSFILVNGTLTIEAILGTTSERKVIIYPNPTVSTLKIEGIAYEKLVIYDLEGKEVYQMIKKDQIDVSGLRSGIHLIHLFDRLGKVIYQQKIVKQ